MKEECWKNAAGVECGECGQRGDWSPRGNCRPCLSARKAVAKEKAARRKGEERFCVEGKDGTLRWSWRLANKAAEAGDAEAIEAIRRRVQQRAYDKRRDASPARIRRRAEGLLEWWRAHPEAVATNRDKGWRAVWYEWKVAEALEGRAVEGFTAMDVKAQWELQKGRCWCTEVPLDWTDWWPYLTRHDDDMGMVAGNLVIIGIPAGNVREGMVYAKEEGDARPELPVAEAVEQEGVPQSQIWYGGVQH